MVCSYLCETDLKRIKSESRYAENIRRENELNNRIREENSDLIITSDGSYPEYYNQKKRILIIGREDRNLCGADYNEVLFEAYKNKMIGVKNGYKTPNQHPTHRKILKFAKGLENDLEYSKIEDANTLADELGEKDGYSFAYVNASKASNVKDNSQTLNKPQYKEFIKRCKKNRYLEEQMGILEPDLAIGMHLSKDTVECLGKVEEIAKAGASTLYEVKTKNGGNFDFINLGYHFAAWRNETNLYNEALKLSRLKKK